MMDDETKDTSEISSKLHSLQAENSNLMKTKALRSGTIFESEANNSDNPRKSFKRLNDIFNILPVHFTGKLRDIDNLLAKVLIEVHSSLILAIHEISVVDSSLLSYLEESEEWEGLISEMRRSIISFRKNIKKQVHGITSLVELPEESKFNIESFINMDSKVINKVTGITEFPPDIKKSLSDIVGILGSEAESKIDHVTQDNTIKVGIT